jgi:hypothetical protein
VLLVRAHSFIALWRTRKILGSSIIATLKRMKLPADCETLNTLPGANNQGLPQHPQWIDLTIKAWPDLRQG